MKPTNQDRDDIQSESLDELFQEQTGLDLSGILDDPECYDAIAGTNFGRGYWVSGGTIAGLMLEGLRAGRRLQEEEDAGTIYELRRAIRLAMEAIHSEDNTPEESLRLALVELEDVEEHMTDDED